MQKYKSISDALTDLRSRGYEADYSAETFCLYCGDLDLRLNPEQFKVDEEYRFEGEATHEEDAVLVAITSSNGIKGVLVDSYGSYSENAGLSPARRRHHGTAPVPTSLIN